MSNEKIIEAILKHKIVVICRGVYGQVLLDTVKALYDGGIRLIEVTFDQADPEAVQKTKEAIQSIVTAFPDMFVGAGTVTKKEHVDATLEAGGQFCLSPHVDSQIIQYTKLKGLVSIPGALTPSEILLAHESGADIVKVFPAGWLTERYFKDIRGPINHVKLLAAAGITEENIQSYQDAGCVAFGISGRLFNKECIQKRDFMELTRRASTFVNLVGLE